MKSAIKILLCALLLPSLVWAQSTNFITPSNAPVGTFASLGALEALYPSPPTGVTAYITGTSSTVQWNGAAWVSISSGSLSAIAANSILSNNSGSSGIPIANTALPTGATTAAGGVVLGNSDSGTFTNKSISGSANTLTNLPAAALTGTVPAAALPNPSGSTLGGIESISCASHNWISVISTSGVPSCTQPGFADISGSVAASQMPALTGVCVTTAGSVAVTCPIPQNPQSGNYTLLPTDAEQEIYHNSVSAHTFTIPANSSVAYVIGTCVMLTNEPGGGSLTIAITTDTLYFFGDTGSRTIAAFGSAVACKKTATIWYINGYGISRVLIPQIYAWSDAANDAVFDVRAAA